jgi:hypothetical protein
MTDDLTQAVLATLGGKRLAGPLDVAATAKLLGFTVSDIRILMDVSKLTPLGDSAPTRRNDSRRSK